MSGPENDGIIFVAYFHEELLTIISEVVAHNLINVWVHRGYTYIYIVRGGYKATWNQGALSWIHLQKKISLLNWRSIQYMYIYIHTYIHTYIHVWVYCLLVASQWGSKLTNPYRISHNPVGIFRMSLWVFFTSLLNGLHPKYLSKLSTIDGSYKPNGYGNSIFLGFYGELTGFHWVTMRCTFGFRSSNGNPWNMPSGNST